MAAGDSGIKYIDRPDAPEIEEEKPKTKRPRNTKPRAKNDPKLVEAARELRDRYMEQANMAANGLLPSACGKYDVSRQLEAAPSTLKQTPPPIC